MIAPDETVTVSAIHADSSKGEIEVVVSPGKTVVLRPLGGGDIRTVNRITGMNVGNLGENQALFAIVSINGEKLIKVNNEMHLENRANRFDGKEYLALIKAYGDAFYEDIADPKS